MPKDSIKAALRPASWPHKHAATVQVKRGSISNISLLQMDAFSAMRNEAANVASTKMLRKAATYACCLSCASMLATEAWLGMWVFSSAFSLSSLSLLSSSSKLSRGVARIESTRRRTCAVKAPNTTEVKISTDAVMSTAGPKVPPSVAICTNWEHNEKRISTTMSLSTVMPSVIFATSSSWQCISAITAMALAGLLAVIRAEVNKQMENFAMAVGCISRQGTWRRPEPCRKNRPIVTKLIVQSVMDSTCKPI
mmetsp:Transcript_56271/g.182350  ORF Transcript_56271/g.182350 Transcript_56271/m.182350 type:complete len:252 (+) Transcript_56271:727-1482(+)